MVCCAAALLPALTLGVFADFGPKASITVIVNNPPDADYLMDLLVDYPIDPDYNYAADLEDEELRYPDLVARLRDYRDGDWRPMMATGANGPISGRVIPRERDGRLVNEFGYYGTPERFRILIVSADGQIRVSDIIARNAFNFSVTFDYETGAIRYRGLVASLVVQLLTTLLPTLLIEGALLAMSPLSLRDNWRIFLGANFVTQLAMTAVVWIADATVGSFFILLFFFIPMELAIMAAEAWAYRRHMRGGTPRDYNRYAIFANVASGFAGAVCYYLGFVYA